MIRYHLTDSSYRRSFGIALLLDPMAEQAVRSIWTGLAQAGITSSLPAIVCALPHISLIICQDLEPAATIEGLRQFAAATPPFQISFSALGAFPTATGTAVFLQPTGTQALLCAHRRGYHRLQPHLQAISSFYQPDRWLPHCSLAIGVPATIAKDALSYCLSLPWPLLGQVQAVSMLEMLTYDRQVLAGCERARFSLGDGRQLPTAVCPVPADCPFINRQTVWETTICRNRGR